MKKSIDIETVLRELYTVSGCRVSIHDCEYTEIAAYPHDLSPFCSLIQTNRDLLAGCIRADTEALSRVRTSESPYIYRCHMGLYEAVAPLYHAGVLTGYLMMGQVADNAEGAREDIFRRAEAAAGQSGVTPRQLREEIGRLASISAPMFSSFVNIMTICAEYITLSGRMELPAWDLGHMLKKYIYQNYSRHLTLDELCRTFCCSKSTLMNTFRRAYGITVWQYITEVRLTRAKELLAGTDHTVRSIAAECGYSEQGYFTKAFAAEVGMSPTEYRRKCIMEGHERSMEEIRL